MLTYISGEVNRTAVPDNVTALLAKGARVLRQWHHKSSDNYRTRAVTEFSDDGRHTCTQSRSAGQDHQAVRGCRIPRELYI
jgi:hypothetical protein